MDTYYRSSVARYHCIDSRLYPQQQTEKENRKRRTGSLLAAVSKKIEYYDDEELDLFIGKEADAYTEEETNQFRDVLYTMQDIDVAGWVRSLQLRGIELPDDLKDEVFLIIGERRTAGHKEA